MSNTAVRRRRDFTRPERVTLDFGSIVKVALLVTVFSFLLALVLYVILVVLFGVALALSA